MTNYRKGYLVELEVVAMADDAECFLALRAPASKGSVDVFVWDNPNRSFTCWAISVKRNDWPSPEERQAMTAWHRVNWVPLIARKWVARGRRDDRWNWHRVTESGGSVPIDGPPWGAR